MGAEKSQALMSITVQAWKCQECCATSESLRAKAVCEKRGHSVVQVKVDRTRWECKNCSFSIFALDKHLPPHCHRCKSMVWGQVPLQRVQKAPMEKELLLPRGEEIRFLNSLPGARVSTFMEATD